MARLIFRAFEPGNVQAVLGDHHFGGVFALGGVAGISVSSGVTSTLEQLIDARLNPVEAVAMFLWRYVVT